MKKFAPLAVLFILLLAIFISFRPISKGTDSVANAQPIFTQVSPPAPTPTITPEIQTQILEQPSPDGSVKLTEKILKTQGGDHYIFSATNNSTNATKPIFDTTEKPGISYQIPDNSWSPDNKQFFVTKISPDGYDYLVFKADGSGYLNGGMSLDVTSFWLKSKFSALSIKTLTGWAGDDLIVVYTTKNDGTDGPAFWFVTSSHAFLQLSR